LTTTSRIAALGLAMSPPPGWEAAIFRRPAAPGEVTFPVLHAATLPLPSHRGDYGGGLVELLGALDVFVSLLEFGPDAARTALFRDSHGTPRLTPGAFRPNQLQRIVRNQAGAQRFFTARGRAFCLYAVVGSFANRGPLSLRANQLIGSLEIAPAS
jgi:hypothetical protein